MSDPVPPLYRRLAAQTPAEQASALIRREANVTQGLGPVSEIIWQLRRQRQGPPQQPKGRATARPRDRYDEMANRLHRNRYSSRPAARQPADPLRRPGRTLMERDVLPLCRSLANAASRGPEWPALQAQPRAEPRPGQTGVGEAMGQATRAWHHCRWMKPNGSTRWP
jgi:hypothetical protein